MGEELSSTHGIFGRRNLEKTRQDVLNWMKQKQRSLKCQWGECDLLARDLR